MDWQGFTAAMVIVLPLIAKLYLDLQAEKRRARTEELQNAEDRQLTTNMSTSHRRRASIAARRDGLVHFSPTGVSLTDFGRRLVEPVREEITRWYAEEGHTLTTDKLFWAMEEYFGDLIVRTMCERHNYTELQCFTAVVALCRETQIAGRPKPPSWRPEPPQAQQGSTESEHADESASK